MLQYVLQYVLICTGHVSSSHTRLATVLYSTDIPLKSDLKIYTE